METGVKVLRHREKKPACGQEILSVLNQSINSSSIKGDSDLKPGQIAVIGDRLLTDIVMANRMGMFSILVTDIITEHGDNPMAKLARRWERWILS